MCNRHIMFMFGNVCDTCLDTTSALKNSGCMIRNMETKLSARLENGKWKSTHGGRATCVRDLMRILYEAYVEEYGEPEAEQSDTGPTKEG